MLSGRFSCALWWSAPDLTAIYHCLQFTPADSEGRDNCRSHRNEWTRGREKANIYQQLLLITHRQKLVVVFKWKIFTQTYCQLIECERVRINWPSTQQYIVKLLSPNSAGGRSHLQTGSAIKRFLVHKRFHSLKIESGLIRLTLKSVFFSSIS